MLSHQRDMLNRRRLLLPARGAFSVSPTLSLRIEALAYDISDQATADRELLVCMLDCTWKKWQWVGNGAEYHVMSALDVLYNLAIETHLSGSDEIVRDLAESLLWKVVREVTKYDRYLVRRYDLTHFGTGLHRVNTRLADSLYQAIQGWLDSAPPSIEETYSGSLRPARLIDTDYLT
jgi:hypothetical protein